MSDVKDLLTPDERRALDMARQYTPESPVIAALDRLAPKPAPPAPRVSELAERWRDESRTFEDVQCADELDAALERDRARVARLLADNSHETFTHATRLAKECGALLIGGDMFRSIVSAVIVESEKRLRAELSP